MKKESNFFDDLQPLNTEERERYTEAQQAEFMKLSYLTHRVFVENESGRELLAKWREAMEMNAVVEPGLDLGEIGAREGYNRFIRLIIRSIRQVEAEAK